MTLEDIFKVDHSGVRDPREWVGIWALARGVELSLFKGNGYS